jgi:hypothetical protein
MKQGENVQKAFRAAAAQSARIAIDAVTQEGVTFDVQVQDSVAFVQMFVSLSHLQMRALIEQYQRQKEQMQR